MCLIYVGGLSFRFLVSSQPTRDPHYSHHLTIDFPSTSFQHPWVSSHRIRTTPDGLCGFLWCHRHHHSTYLWTPKPIRCWSHSWASEHRFVPLPPLCPSFGYGKEPAWYWWLGFSLHLGVGPFYYLYMSMLSTFCTNSINILAGVNGVEVGQSIIICLSIILNDLLYIRLDLNDLGLQHAFSFGLSRGSQQLEDRHMFSFCLMSPLLAVMLALIKYNWFVFAPSAPAFQRPRNTYCPDSGLFLGLFFPHSHRVCFHRYPARTFVGDTFCYFAGMAFAVVGILGHFSKTLLLFFIPQIFNFLYSCPQLFGLIPIPRHRLPSRDPQTDLLKPSIVLFTQPCCYTKTLIGLERLRLIRLNRNREGLVIGCSNLTVLNLLLIWFGDMREDRLTMLVMGSQILGSLVGFGIRYGMSGLFYELSTRRWFLFVCLCVCAGGGRSFCYLFGMQI